MCMDCTIVTPFLILSDYPMKSKKYAISISTHKLPDIRRGNFNSCCSYSISVYIDIKVTTNRNTMYVGIFCSV